MKGIIYSTSITRQINKCGCKKHNLTCINYTKLFKKDPIRLDLNKVPHLAIKISSFFIKIMAVIVVDEVNPDLMERDARIPMFKIAYEVKKHKELNNFLDKLDIYEKQYKKNMPGYELISITSIYDLPEIFIEIINLVK